MVIIKGMNHLKTREGRIKYIKILLRSEWEKIQCGSHNQVVSKLVTIEQFLTSTEPNTPFIKALESAEKRIKGASSNKRDEYTDMDKSRSTRTKFCTITHPLDKT